jgi:4-hydroxy-tetrahydrodipicolinate reductase
MKIALFGHGRMGTLVEEAGVRGGHEVVCVVTGAGTTGELRNADVAIDFSEPGAVLGNLRRACDAQVPVAIGTTGWYDRVDEARAMVQDAGIGCVYGANFSIGVNLMFALAREAARLFAPFGGYDAFIEEAHHKMKKDAPSGTALVLKRSLEAGGMERVAIGTLRAGYIPGTHTVGFDSEADTLTIAHVARGRAGFVEGALAAAAWVVGRRGFFEFADVMVHRRQP